MFLSGVLSFVCFIYFIPLIFLCICLKLILINNYYTTNIFRSWKKLCLQECPRCNVQLQRVLCHKCLSKWRSLSWTQWYLCWYINYSSLLIFIYLFFFGFIFFILFRFKYLMFLSILMQHYTLSWRSTIPRDMSGFQSPPMELVTSWQSNDFWMSVVWSNTSITQWRSLPWFAWKPFRILPMSRSWKGYSESNSRKALAIYFHRRRKGKRLPWKLLPGTQRSWRPTQLQRGSKPKR